MSRLCAMLFLLLSVFFIPTEASNDCSGILSKFFTTCNFGSNCPRTVCTGKTGCLKCNNGVIAIKSFFFGRRDLVLCSTSKQKLCTGDADFHRKQLSNAKRICEGEKECKIKAAYDFKDECQNDWKRGTLWSGVWGDLCDSYSKYIDVTFTCINGKTWEESSVVEWSEWGSCSSSCGGVQLRERNCFDNVNKTCTRSTCKFKELPVGKQNETRPCNTSCVSATTFHLYSSASITKIETSSFEVMSKVNVYSKVTSSVKTTSSGPEKGASTLRTTSLQLETSALSRENKSMHVFSSSAEEFATSSLLLKGSVNIKTQSSFLNVVTISKKFKAMSSDSQEKSSMNKSSFQYLSTSVKINSSKFLAASKVSSTQSILTTQSSTQSSATKSVTYVLPSEQISQFLQSSTTSNKVFFSSQSSFLTYVKETMKVGVSESLIKVDPSEVFTRVESHSSVLTTPIPTTTRPIQPSFYGNVSLTMIWEEFCKFEEEFREGIARLLTKRVKEKLDADQVVITNIDNCKVISKNNAQVHFYIAVKSSREPADDLTKIAVQELMMLVTEGRTSELSSSFPDGKMTNVVLVFQKDTTKTDEEWPTWLTVLITVAAVIFLLWLICCIWIFCCCRKKKTSAKKFSKLEADSNVYTSTLQVNIGGKYENPAYEMKETQVTSDYSMELPNKTKDLSDHGSDDDSSESEGFTTKEKPAVETNVGFQPITLTLSNEDL